LRLLSSLGFYSALVVPLFLFCSTIYLAVGVLAVFLPLLLCTVGLPLSNIFGFFVALCFSSPYDFAACFDCWIG